MIAALHVGGVAPGATYTIPGGRYVGDFVADVVGTAEAPVIFRAAAGERVVIDGSLIVNGAHVWLWDVEIEYSGWTSRISTQTGSAPSDIPTSKKMEMFGVGDKLINSVVHDTAGAIGLWTPAVDAEIYGVLVYNTGWDAPDRGHGHALYTQNLTGTKSIQLFAAAQGYSDFGVHAYTQGGSIQGFDFTDVVNYPSLFLVGGYQPVDRLTIKRGYLRGILQLGYDAGVTNGSAGLADVTARGGLLAQDNWGVNDVRITQTGSRYGAVNYNEVDIAANEYDDDRALIVIYNDALRNWVTLDLSALPLTIGRRYVLRNAQNYMEGYSFTYTGAAVDVPMTSWTVATPIAAASPLMASTFPSFGTFFVERDWS